LPNGIRARFKHAVSGGGEVTDFTDIKAGLQQTWGAGDYSVIATALYPTAEVLCEDVNFSAGQRILDVACGSGNVSLAAARRGAVVTGIDFVAALLERAQERAAAEWLEIDFREADAEALPFDDGSFDAVLSGFGVMFAPDQERAAAELLRVCRPGGVIGLANWTPNSAATELTNLVAEYVPQAPDLRSPDEWGTASRLKELFGSRVRSMTIKDRSFLWRDLSAERLVENYRANLGQMSNAFAQLDPRQSEELSRGLAQIALRHNRATDNTIASAFSYVTVVINT
jgi:ubiquinone/menaquinone biosynthesis C-methylase UbiE